MPPNERTGPHAEGAGSQRNQAGDAGTAILAHPSDNAEQCALCPLARCHSFCRGVVDQPRRVKVAGDLWHGCIPDGAIYVGRQAIGLKRSRYANPHVAGKPCKVCAGRVHTPAEAVDMYRQHFHGTPGLPDAARRELLGHDLCCWCPPNQPCHADFLLAVVNGGAS